MTEKDLQFFKAWYSDYTNSFHTTEKKEWRHLNLKIEHTEYVRKLVSKIAGSLSLTYPEIMLAETIAIFHDLGRFRQFSQHKTFQDRISKNHGLLGAKTLIEQNILKDLSKEEQVLILQSVKFHNAFAIPTMFDNYLKTFLKMIRDADKLDIFRVFIKYYESPSDSRASEVAFGLPDTEGYSDEIISCLRNRQSASYRSLRSENDFKLLKLSWVYELHFDYSLRVIQECDYVNRIADKLPRTDEVRLAVTEVQAYIAEKL